MPDDPARARKYLGFFNGSNEAERIFLAELPQVTQFVNLRLRDRGYTFTLSQAEVAINFITEGGYFALEGDVTAGLDAFQYLGVDNYFGMREVYRGWVPGYVDALASQATNRVCTQNEKGEPVCTLTGLSFREGLYLNAGAFAYHAAMASRDIPKYAELPLLARFFWATIYYNSGIGHGRSLVRQHGVDYYKLGWSGAANNRVPRFNATWRTRSLDLLLTQLPAMGQ